LSDSDALMGQLIINPWGDSIMGSTVIIDDRDVVMVLSATFNNISVVSVSLAEETGVIAENHRPTCC